MSIEKIIDGANEYCNPSDVANSLNSYYSSVGERVAEKFDGQTGFAEYLEGNYVNSFNFYPTTSHSIHEIIFSLKNKNCEINLFPASILKHIRYIISPVLSILINRSLSNGVFPEACKSSSYFQGRAPNWSQKLPTYLYFAIIQQNFWKTCIQSIV